MLQGSATEHGIFVSLQATLRPKPSGRTCYKKRQRASLLTISRPIIEIPAASSPGNEMESYSTPKYANLGLQEAKLAFVEHLKQVNAELGHNWFPTTIVGPLIEDGELLSDSSS